MKISDVRVKIVNLKNRKMKAWASVIFDDEFVIHNLKIIDGSRGLFVAMPNRRTRDGEYRDTAHPLSHTMRKNIEDAVIDEYKKAIAQQP